MKSKHLLLAGVISAGVFFNAASTHAQLIYTSGHGDIGVAYEEGELEPHWHLGPAAIVNGDPLGGEGGEFAPDEIAAFGVSTLLVNSGNVSALSSLLGVSLGDSIYVLGSDFSQPNLGWAAEELDASDWMNGQITITLNGITGPGEFALFRIDEDDGSIFSARFSSLNPGATTGGNVLTIPAGGHTHYVFGFTEPGYYELNLTFAGTHNIDGYVSADGTFGMHAGVIPEPSTYGLIIVAALLGLLMLRGKRQRQTA